MKRRKDRNKLKSTYFIHRLYQDLFPLLSKWRTVSQYTSECNIIYNKITAFPAPIFKKLTNAQEICVQLLYTEFQRNWTVDVGSGRAMAQAVSRRPLIAEARLRSGVSPCGIGGRQIGTGTGFSPSTSVFPCQFHSTGAPLLGKMKKTDHLSLHLHHRIAQ